MTTPSDPAALEKKTERKPIAAAIGAFLWGLGLLLLELLLPALIAGGVIWYLFSSYNVWAIERTLSLVLYGAAVIVLALVLSVAGDSLLAALRRAIAGGSASFFNNANLRLVKMALGGLALPIAAVLALNLVQLNAAGTPMQAMIAAANKPVVLTPPGEVGQIAVSSKDPSTKLHAIQVLENFRTLDALNELIRVANGDPAALTDAGVRAGLVKAVASYGLSARSPLISMFNSVDPAMAGKSSAASSGLYEQYFAAGFESLKADTELAPASSARDNRLAQIQAAQFALKRSLSEMETGTSASLGGDPRLDFVMQAFLAMDFSTDKDVLAFAKTVSADARYSGQVRGDALLLIAKLGDKNDLDGLYPYLKTTDSLLQARALQAIAALQDKINHTVGK